MFFLNSKKLTNGIVSFLVGMLILQASMITAFLNPTKAKAAEEPIENPITQINFTTPERTVNQNTASEVLTTQTQDADGNLTKVSSTKILMLESSSATGEFSSNANTWSTTTELQMNSETANKNFYYKDSNPGTHTLTVTVKDKTTGELESWTPATQTITIITPEPSPSPTPSESPEPSPSPTPSESPEPDTQGPVLKNVGFTANGSVMPGSLEGGFILNADGNHSTTYNIQFTDTTTTSKQLKDEHFPLTLVNKSVDTQTLLDYYDANYSDPWKTYLKDAAQGNEPFAYIYEGSVKLADGAVYSLTGTNSDMRIPGDYPEGYYVVSGDIADSDGNTTTVTFKLIVDSSKPTVDIDLDQNQYNENNFPQPITGDAQDVSGITKVQVKIKDTTASPAVFWNGSAWVTESNTWNDATLGNSWSYQFDPVNLTYGRKYEVKARAYDSLNKVSDVKTKSFNFVDDIAPVITLLDDNPQTIEVGSEYVELGATAEDNYDGDITANIDIDASNVDVTTLGTYQVVYTVTDSSGNTTTETRTVNVEDNELPTGTITINNGAKVTNNQKVTLDFTYNDAHQMRYGTHEFSIEDTTTWQDVINTADFDLPATGVNTVYVQYKDIVGNVSPNYSASIYYNELAENIKLEDVDSSTTSLTYENIEISNPNGIAKEAQNTTITFAQYTGNPEGNFSGISAFGKFFDISVLDKDAINWPIIIRVWFTQEDLDKINATIDQIKGLYFWNGTSWELYPNTYRVDKVHGEYIGYVEALVDHFTPMSLAADITAPEKPTNFKAESLDSKIKLTWDKVNDAIYYRVRYRPVTSNDTSEEYLYLDAHSTEIEITNLENGKMYEFGVQAVDDVENTSDYVVVNATPTKEEVKVATGVIAPTKRARTYLGWGVATAQTSETQDTDKEKEDEKKDETEIETISPDGKVEGADDETDTQESSRAVVTIAILIIAAGAGLGGYYGYQWWLEKETPEATVTTKKPGKKDKGGRW